MDAEILSHAVYRPLLQAMARPGTVQQLPDQARREPVLHLLAALADEQVSLHVRDDEPLARALARETGCRLAPAAEADFVIFPDGRSDGLLALARRGSAEYPDAGATVVFPVRRLSPTGGRVRLRGPGIPGAAEPHVEGLDPAEWGLLRQANALFPLGVDAVFLDDEGQLLCVPRSTRIEER